MYEPKERELYHLTDNEYTWIGKKRFYKSTPRALSVAIVSLTREQLHLFTQALLKLSDALVTEEVLRHISVGKWRLKTAGGRYALDIRRSIAREPGKGLCNIWHINYALALHEHYNYNYESRAVYFTSPTDLLISDYEEIELEWLALRMHDNLWDTLIMELLNVE